MRCAQEASLGAKALAFQAALCYQLASADCMRLLVSANLLFTALICGTALAAPPLPAEKELASFHFADPNLAADLIASEPDVISPVCLA